MPWPGRSQNDRTSTFRTTVAKRVSNYSSLIDTIDNEFRCGRSHSIHSIYYSEHPRDGEGTVFTDVCLFTPGGTYLPADGGRGVPTFQLMEGGTYLPADGGTYLVANGVGTPCPK